MATASEPVVASSGSPSVSERVAAGRAARAAVPRRSHAKWEPPADRRDPVELLEEQAASARPRARTDALRAHARLAVRVLPRRRVPDGGRPRRRCPTRACRCSCAATRTCRTSARSRRPTAGSCSTSTTSTRRCPGPFEWDVKRLVASFAVAGREPRLRCLAIARTIDRTVARSYREAMGEFAEMGDLDVWYSRIDVDDLIAADIAPRRQRKERHARRARPRQGAARRTACARSPS